MTDAQILGLYLTGFWVFTAHDLSKRTRQITSLAFFCAAVAVSIRIIFKIVS